MMYSVKNKTKQNNQNQKGGGKVTFYKGKKHF